MGAKSYNALTNGRLIRSGRMASILRVARLIRSSPCPLCVHMHLFAKAKSPRYILQSSLRRRKCNEYKLFSSNRESRPAMAKSSLAHTVLEHCDCTIYGHSRKIPTFYVRPTHRLTTLMLIAICTLGSAASLHVMIAPRHVPPEHVGPPCPCPRREALDLLRPSLAGTLLVNSRAQR